MADRLASRLPPPNDGRMMDCACGTVFDSHDVLQVQAHVRHINFAKRAQIGGW
jgi:hypothetical protein